MAERLTRIDSDAPMALWLADLSIVPAQAELTWLSEREQARAARFRFDRDRERYQAVHVAVRSLIGEQAGIAPDAQQFVANPSGKLALVDAGGWRFSFSYAGEKALIGLSYEAEIGVDAEVIRAIDDLDALAELHYTPAERASIAAAADPAERTRAFLRCWTRKEACVKAVGLGLSIAPSSFECGTGADLVTVMVGSQRVEVGPVPLGQERVGAWCRLVGAG